MLGDPKAPGVGPDQVIRLLARAIHDVAGTRPVDPNWDRRGGDVQQYELRVKRLDIRFDETLERTLQERHASREMERNRGRARSRSSTGPPAFSAYFDALGQTTAPGGCRPPDLDA